MLVLPEPDSIYVWLAIYSILHLPDKNALEHAWAEAEQELQEVRQLHAESMQEIVHEIYIF